MKRIRHTEHFVVSMAAISDLGNLQEGLRHRKQLQCGIYGDKIDCL